jgi:hypothetical protein
MDIFATPEWQIPPRTYSRQYEAGSLSERVSHGLAGVEAVGERRVEA